MTNGQHESDSDPYNAKEKSVEERLKIVEEMVAQSSRAVTSLAERVRVRVSGARVAKDLRTATLLTTP